MSVKIRRGDFTTYTRQRALEPPTQDTVDRWRPPRKGSSNGGLQPQPDAAVRLLGVGVSDLQMLRQTDLFAPGRHRKFALGLGDRRDPGPLWIGYADPCQPVAALSRGSEPA